MWRKANNLMEAGVSVDLVERNRWNTNIISKVSRIAPIPMLISSAVIYVVCVAFGA
jgi:hypothetical protein